MEILNMCISKENGHYWFYKMDEEIIPLQVLKNQSPESVFEKEVHTCIDSATGPLWRATYITSDETLKENNTFTSNILFTFHHAIIDGYTAVNICNSFLKALNDVIGENVQKIYDFGQFNDGHETKELLIQRTEYLKSNLEYCEEIRTMKSKFDNAKVLLTEYFPVPKDAEKKTKFIHGELNKEITANLIEIFKSKGISFHAGFCSVFNWVLMDILTEKGLTEKEIELTTTHALNLRRYWKKSSSGQLGVHAKFFSLLSKTDQNIGKNFWEYAKEFNKELKSGIENMRAIDWIAEEYLANISSEPQLDDSLKLIEKVSSPSITIPSFLLPPPKTYYVTSNVGDISSILKSERDNVNIKFLSRGTSIPSKSMNMLVFLQTFKGKLSYCMAYSAYLVTDDYANLCKEKLINKLQSICTRQFK
ncbi:hypothetical protein Anas_14360 [Armadillidium nasatum]|uniref:Condensation domain-containing protein n=1 Tax=Armadillidium nasatum TaxID=96803 RepID=A0A5N5SJY0_9CRUS|nr:hypothetical protein Anas_14360 [Armadillidium nasatum]